MNDEPYTKSMFRSNQSQQKKRTIYYRDSICQIFLHSRDPQVTGSFTRPSFEHSHAHRLLQPAPWASFWGKRAGDAAVAQVRQSATNLKKKSDTSETLKISAFIHNGHVIAAAAVESLA
ncbi:hypothetical protein [Pseudomonas putida]